MIELWVVMVLVMEARRPENGVAHDRGLKVRRPQQRGTFWILDRWFYPEVRGPGIWPRSIEE
jgi:hypothetical protein